MKRGCRADISIQETSAILLYTTPYKETGLPCNIQRRLGSVHIRAKSTGTEKSYHYLQVLFTIPQEYYAELGFDRETICTIGDEIRMIQPAASIPSGGEFTEQILSELIQEGFSGPELLDECKTRQAKVRLAVEAMLETAKSVALGIGEYATYDDIFGEDEGAL